MKYLGNCNDKIDWNAVIEDCKLKAGNTNIFWEKLSKKEIIEFIIASNEKVIKYNKKDDTLDFESDNYANIWFLCDKC
jgi:hypothetical protein